MSMNRQLARIACLCLLGMALGCHTTLPVLDVEIRHKTSDDYEIRVLTQGAKSAKLQPEPQRWGLSGDDIRVFKLVGSSLEPSQQAAPEPEWILPLGGARTLTDRIRRIAVLGSNGQVVKIIPGR